MTYHVRPSVWIVYLVTIVWLTSQPTWTHRALREHTVHWVLNLPISTSALLVHSTIEQWVMILTTAFHAPVSICSTAFWKNVLEVNSFSLRN